MESTFLKNSLDRDYDQKGEVPRNDISTLGSIKSDQCSACIHGFERSEDLTKHLDFHSRLQAVMENPPANLKPQLLLNDDVSTEGTKSKCHNDPKQPHHLRLTIVNRVNGFAFQQYKCADCPYTKSVLTKDQIDKHLPTQVKSMKDRKLLATNVEKRKAPFKCPKCPSRFQTIDERHEHKNMNHRDYKCTFCPETFTTVHDQKKHIASHTKERPNHCYTCDKSFPSKPLFKEHQLIHTGEIQHECKICHRRFLWASHLQQHMTAHNEQASLEVHTNQQAPIKETLHTCGGCKKSFYTKFLLESHMESHKPKTLCDFCYKDFINEESLQQHMEIHKELGKYQCKQCAVKFMTHSSSIYHRLTHVKSDIKNKCKFCGGEYFHPLLLKSHILTHTSLDGIFTCGICQKTFSTPEDLEVHKSRLHIEIKTIRCRICSYVALNLFEMRDHQAVSHRHEVNRSCHICNLVFLKVKNGHDIPAPGIVCGLCKEKFSTTNMLLFHMKSHIEKSKPKGCFQCGKKFSSPLDLKLHIWETYQNKQSSACRICSTVLNRIYDPEEKRNTDSIEMERCTICSKMCDSAENLNSHMFFHLKARYFPCPLCEKTFHDLCDLQRHTKSHQNEFDDVPTPLGILGAYEIKEEQMESDEYEEDFSETDDDNQDIIDTYDGYQLADMRIENEMDKVGETETILQSNEIKEEIM